MITNLLLTVISLGTWRGAGHSKHTAQGVAQQNQMLHQQNQMLFDAMPPEQQQRVLTGAAERKRIAEEAHAQMLREGADRAFMWRVGIWGVVLLAGAMALVSKPTSTMQRVLESKPQVAAQPVAKPKPKSEESSPYMDCVNSTAFFARRMGSDDPLGEAWMVCDSRLKGGRHNP